MYDVIIIGAGPAGLMAAINLKNKKILLIEKNETIGKKLLITGGSRCNITNLKNTDEFLKNLNNEFLKCSLNSFGPKQIFKFFEKRNLKLKIEEDDKVFPFSNKSNDILDILKKEIKDKVELNLNENVIDIDFKTKEVITNKDKYKSKNIIIATGGLSYPNTGSTGDGYKFAKKNNQKTTSLYPSQTYLTTKESYDLSGITIDKVIIKYENHISNGSMLFTHKGISGPSVFKISEHVYKNLKNNSKIIVDFINYNEEELINKILKYDKNKEIKSFFREFLPRRLVDKVINTNKKIKFINIKEIKELINKFKNFEIEIKSTGTISQSFVTGGGIDLNYINEKTMESKIYKNVYFIGEVLDIHGNTGGYNITIAMSSGYSAATDINKR